MNRKFILIISFIVITILLSQFFEIRAFNSPKNGAEVWIYKRSTHGGLAFSYFKDQGFEIWDICGTTVPNCTVEPCPAVGWAYWARLLPGPMPL